VTLLDTVAIVGTILPYFPFTTNTGSVTILPFHIRKQIESELETLEKLDIIERLDGPTP
jgi:hypothetical protein